MTKTRSSRANPNDVAIGTVYGRWTVKGPFVRQGANNSAYFPCVCQCGTEKLVVFRTLNEIAKGKYPEASCGCYQKEVMATKRRHGVEPGTKEWDIARRAWTKYRLSYEDYLTMVEEQNNLCDICGTEMDPPYIDHCHETMKVRGLLCHNCNTVLGHAKDDIAILQKSIAYLERAIVTD
jgi:hypothetical protein